jgi:hypothetical protein
MEDYLVATMPVLKAIGLIALTGLNIYIGKKLSNIATRDDIGKITKEVESVKQVFTNQTEELKHSLAVLTNKESVLFNEEKDALYLYYSAWQLWFNKLTKINVNYIPNARDTHNDILKDLDFTEYENEFDIVMVSMSKLELFLNDERIIQLAKTLNTKALDYQETIEDYLRGDIWERVEMNELMRDSIQPENKDVNIQKEISSSMKEKIKEREITLKEFATNRKNKMLDVHIALGNFIEASRKYIRKDSR